MDVSIIGTGHGDGGVEHGQLLMALVDAAMTLDPAATTDAREALLSATGVPGVVDAAAVTAMFQLNTRAADAAGIPLEAPTVESRGAIGELFGFPAREGGRAP